MPASVRTILFHSNHIPTDMCDHEPEQLDRKKYVLETCWSFTTWLVVLYSLPELKSIQYKNISYTVEAGTVFWNFNYAGYNKFNYTKVKLNHFWLMVLEELCGYHHHIRLSTGPLVILRFHATLFLNIREIVWFSEYTCAWHSSVVCSDSVHLFCSSSLWSFHFIEWPFHVQDWQSLLFL